MRPAGTSPRIKARIKARGGVIKTPIESRSLTSCSRRSTPLLRSTSWSSAASNGMFAVTSTSKWKHRRPAPLPPLCHHHHSKSFRPDLHRSNLRQYDLLLSLADTEHLIQTAAKSDSKFSDDPVVEARRIADQLRYCLGQHTETAQKVSVYLRALLVLTHGHYKPTMVIEI